jgi:anti-sigma regulatory factor (Ser/Thr protein kinase)
MREIALHIMDIAENGISAGADCIHILVNEARKENRLKIELSDNGSGIPPDMLAKVTDPFVTSRTTRRVGLGLSLLKAAAERCEGTFAIESEPGKGTRVSAEFRYDHIDRAPLGDMAGSVPLLIVSHPKIDFVYVHLINGKEFVLDTREIRKEPDAPSLSDPSMFFQLTEIIREAISELSVEN